MPAPVLIIVNESHEGPGLIGEVLKENGVPTDIIDLNAGDAFPSPTDYSAMIVMGGADSANDETAKMKTELSRIREAIEAGIPCFGVCLGLQTLVKAAGGSVRKNAVREVGFRDQDGKFFTAEIAVEGMSDPLMNGLPDVLPMFHLHSETVDLMPEMTLLASGKSCHNQIVRIAPKIYGMQGHLELTDAMFAEWCQKNDWLADRDQADLQQDWTEHKEVLGSTLRSLFGNFLEIAKLL